MLVPTRMTRNETHFPNPGAKTYGAWTSRQDDANFEWSPDPWPGICHRSLKSSFPLRPMESYVAVLWLTFTFILLYFYVTFYS